MVRRYVSKTGTTTEKTTADYFRSHGMQYKTVVFDTTEATHGGIPFRSL